jgi:PPK2 family polyphosphate:nucleotide phosphotransferase
MKIDTKRFRVDKSDKVDVCLWPTQIKPLTSSKKHFHEQSRKHVETLADLQRLHYASERYSILVIFQALDAAGKDGAIRHVMSGVNPQGCEVFSFKQPSTTELLHDFLWRTYRVLPERGRIGIFNRSYYEEVLIARVHPEIVRTEGLPGVLQPDLWTDRYRSIVDMERHLHANGTRIIKIYLHLSKDEQRNRFVERIDEPEKNWKFSMDDIKERAFWDQYMVAFSECLSATSTNDTPWFIVPADDKDDARLIVSQIMIDTLHSLDLHYPETTPQRHRELEAIRQQLVD